ncbi:hypothetical protein PCASD_12038 [Puccinia coronata f. sp. avenae]|uniref:DDE-1 domain-containing protein n=1 Tax=Puccinia coronata f. sp. avenae TaxID=200324 RepID=A0A2N5TDH0_9BASI|nr:hypothetical protein PCASD_12038 [Puccinia coronata f. sp. avenae]
MENYFTRKKKDTLPSVSTDNQNAALLDHSINNPPNIEPNAQDAVAIRLESYLNSYLSAPTKKPPDDIKKKAQVEWERINVAIKSLLEEHKHKLKKQPSLKLDSAMIANLKEFNQLQYDYTIQGVKLPSKAAALSTSQSSFQRFSATNGAPAPSRSGVHLARLISNQARHVIDHKELLVVKRGNTSKHPLLLDNIELLRVLFKWMTEQVPGEFENSQSKSGKKTTSSDAATPIYPGSNGDAWWDMEQLCHQISTKAIPIFETLHPNSQAVFIFDCSSAHGAFSKSALRVQNMNLNPGVQTFSYDSSHPSPDLAGKQKGVKAILMERGLWQYYSEKNCKNNLPCVKFECDKCATSNTKKDAIKHSARLIRQAEDIGYFLSEDQCVSKFMDKSGIQHAKPSSNLVPNK